MFLTDLFQTDCLRPLLDVASDRVFVHNGNVVGVVHFSSASRLHHGLKTGRRVESYDQVALGQLYALLYNRRAHQQVALTKAKSKIAQ